MKNKQDMHKAHVANLRESLLAWYDASGRTLPWRIRPEDRAAGKIAEPYAVWLSEIMLQQTTIAHGTPYWHTFLDEFPRVTELANAERDRVLTLWAGLGYYARARNLHKCAQIIRDEHQGVFPQTEAELLKLPGIGAYTAATIAAICFGEATNIVDGNVERVIGRMFRVETPLPKGKTEIRNYAATLIGPDRPGDYGQALMDLGSNLCTPRSPDCDMCPWSGHCAAHRAGCETDYPKRAKKSAQSIRFGAAFVLTHKNEVLLRRRPDTGLLGGMMGFPGSDWGEMPGDPLAFAPIKRNWKKCEDTVRHIFTHFDLRLDVYRAEISSKQGLAGIWAEVEHIDQFALPTVMRKVLAAAS